MKINAFDGGDLPFDRLFDHPDGGHPGVHPDFHPGGHPGIHPDFHPGDPHGDHPGGPVLVDGVSDLNCTVSIR